MSAQKTKDTQVIYDEASRRIDIFCVIDRTAALHIQSILAQFKGEIPEKRGDNLDLTVIVNTGGGEALQGLAIHDLLRSSGFKIRTIILGEVASSGLAVALAGQERLMHQNAILHFHQTGIEFETPQKVVEPERVKIEQAQVRVIDNLYAAITLANSSLTLRQLRQLERRRVYMAAPEALKLGLVHKIIEHPPLS